MFHLCHHGTPESSSLKHALAVPGSAGLTHKSIHNDGNHIFWQNWRWTKCQSTKQMLGHSATSDRWSFSYFPTLKRLTWVAKWVWNKTNEVWYSIPLVWQSWEKGQHRLKLVQAQFMCANAQRIKTGSDLIFTEICMCVCLCACFTDRET